ncbi:SCO-spondin-like [Oculina patagonica]
MVLCTLGCLDIYKCESCYKIKEEGKCDQHMKECRKTCSGCKGPDSDRYGAEKCQYYKKQGYCNYPSFKYFKCQKTCSICEVDGNWGKWSSWNDCTKSCGGGNQTRKRECNDPKPAYGGKACGDYSEESRTCNTRECPIDGNWGQWGEWNACTKTCKQGKQSRTRECDSPAPQYAGKVCAGKRYDIRVCNDNVPCPVDGNWCEWSEWSTCTKTCKKGSQLRTRKCNSPSPQYGGKTCDGKPKENRTCNEKVPCPIDGNWAEWSSWSTCSKTCKHGKQSRTRECKSPAPQYGGKPCDGKRNEMRICNKDVPCPVDGSWGEWGEWSTCTKTCKQGKQSRTRECNSPAPQYGGKACEGKPKDSRVCNEKVPCPVDGNWGEWSAWNTCSKTCKQGKQSRTRECNSPAPQYGGKVCDGESNQAQVCNKDIPCPVDGNWGEWSEWSTCTKTCKQGKQSRTRECNSPAPQYGGKKCNGTSSQKQVCNQNVPCPVDGNWGEWSEWSTCTKTCKQGKQSRTRECNSPAPQYGGQKCEGQPKETQICNEKVPCPVDGNWGEWSEWNTCSKTCKQGKQSRTRECNSPAPQYGGKKCNGQANETQICNENVPCPVDGNWGEWSEWNTCTKTCKQGKQSRTRECNSPAPQYSGKECDGKPKETQICNEKVPCPVDGNWGEWSEWSTCTKTCKQGKQSRTRECNSPAPQYGGKDCDGKPKETQVCNQNVPCPVDGNWGEWSEWSTCTKTCKQGKQSRTRECNSPAPQYGGKECDGQANETQVCNQNVPCPVDGNWGEWSEWSTCTKTCKQGKQSRTRECNSPTPQYGGKDCDGKPKETQVCNQNVPCPVFDS